MKRKTLTFLIIGILITIALLVWWFFILPEKEAGMLRDPGSAFPSESADIDRTRQEGVKDSLGEDNGMVTDILVDINTPQLRKITANPTTSAVIIETDDRTAIRYVARETGHVFEAITTSTLIERIANTTIPRIQEALFSPDGETLVLRYLANDRETIETFLGKVKKEDVSLKTEGSLIGSFLPQNISAIDINDAGTSLFYLIPTDNGSEGIQTNLEGGGVARLFLHPLKGWGAKYTSNNNLHLTTNPSGAVRGFLYSVNKNGSFTRILSGINGLVAHTNSDNTTILYSESLSNGFTLNTFEIKTGEHTVLPLRTLAEKCIWDTRKIHVIYCAIPKTILTGIYPDVWYQGKVSFSDTLWKLDLEAQTTELLVTPEEVAGESIDVVELIISPDGSLLVFVNKKDSSLWSLTLPQYEEADLNEEE